MATAQRERGRILEWVRGDEEILTELRPGAPFDARASFQAFGERQFGERFASVACCCELPGETSRRWEAALEMRELRTDVVATDAEVAAAVGVEQ